jgi:MFS transporter, DHA1 family, multidrug resistance protein
VPRYSASEALSASDLSPAAVRPASARQGGGFLPLIAGRSHILIFGLLSTMAPLSIDIYLPALPTLRRSLAANESQALITLSAFLIGSGAGQLFAGPLSDRFGRKPLLLAGLGFYILASAGCALASTISAIICWRFLQAFSGCIAPILVQAMVRDLYDRDESARILSLNMLMMGMAPIVAPLLGGQVLLWLGWRAIFWALAGFGVLCFLSAFTLPETLDPSRRIGGRPLSLLLGYFELLRSRRYVGYVGCTFFYFCCLFAFIAGSPFVYIDYFGVSPQYYGFLIAVNMLGMMGASYLNSRAAVRYGADRLLHIACYAGVGASLALVMTGLTGFGGLVGIALPVFITVSLLGVITSNAMSGALATAPGRAGAAAALAGALQFAGGAFSSAFLSWFADGGPRAMSITICAGAVAALLALSIAVGRGTRRAANM